VHHAIGASSSIVACDNFWTEGDLGFLELACGSIASAASVLLEHAWALLADIAEAPIPARARVRALRHLPWKYSLLSGSGADDPRLDCVGSQPYVSPQALSGAAPVSPASDVWGDNL
jgi:hypothetical protein